MILWDSNKFTCLQMVLRFLLVIIKLFSDEDGSFLLSSVCDAEYSNLKKDFWMELSRPFWINQNSVFLGMERGGVRQSFHVIRRILPYKKKIVIRRILEKLGGTRLSPNMRVFFMPL